MGPAGRRMARAMSGAATPSPGDPPWTLSRAMDALGAAARQAGRPGWIWIAGIAYPGWSAFELSFDSRLTPKGTLGVFEGIVLLVAWVYLVRLLAGLARIAHPQDWRRAAEPGRVSPGLGQAWRAGRGLTLSTLGLWILLTGMLWVVVGAALLPVVAAFGMPRGAGHTAALVFALLPLAVFLLAYATMLSILHQLALHSLVRNRRGVGSALVHAWRIARHDPRRTLHAFLGELVLSLSIYLLGSLIVITAGFLLTPLAWFLGLALAGFAGVTRAAYWAQAYRELGGLSPEDRVPGLEEGGARAHPL